MIDPELVTRKMLLITEDLRAVEPLTHKTRKEFLATPTDQVLAERYLERIIGRMIDINYHLLTSTGQAPPKDYFQSFTALGDAGILDHEFAQRIAACAGLRNRIVHEYETIDPARLHEALDSAVRDVTSYLQAVAGHLQL